MATNGTGLTPPTSSEPRFSATAAGTYNVNLEYGGYIVLVTEVDTNNPDAVTITDSAGNAVTFAQHGAFRYAAWAKPNGVYTIAVGGGVNSVTLYHGVDNDGRVTNASVPQSFPGAPLR